MHQSVYGYTHVCMRAPIRYTAVTNNTAMTNKHSLANKIYEKRFKELMPNCLEERGEDLIMVFKEVHIYHQVRQSRFL